MGVSGKFSLSTGKLFPVSTGKGSERSFSAAGKLMNVSTEIFSIFQPCGLTPKEPPNKQQRSEKRDATPLSCTVGGKRGPESLDSEKLEKRGSF